MDYRTALVALAGVCGSLSAQTDPLRFDRVDLLVDSGVLGSAQGGLVYSEMIDSPGADWVRLWFGETVLPAGAELLITSARTGEHQVLNAETLAQWSNSSAYFAGDAVYVDVVMPAGAKGRVVVTGVHAGLPPLAPRTICGSVDDRVLSNDPRAARLAPQGCTAWLFNNRANTAATADHCGAAGGDTLWFNVPLRTSGGGVVPPSPRDQYPVDGTSVQDAGSFSLGNDWSVFGVFDNSNTGLSPVDAQKASYVLATSAPAADQRPINITGYGSTSFPVPDSWYAVQKTHSGAYWSRAGTVIRYRADTTGGNSGSAVFDEQEQRVIGVHTNGGCTTSTTSSNSGTSIDNAGWRSALMQSRGVAAGPIPAVIRPLEALPSRVEPDGSTTVGVELVADFMGTEPQQGVTLHSNDGSGWVETEMSSGFAGDWFASIPPTGCGSDVSYYFTATGSDGTPVAFPPSAPGVTFTAVSSAAWDVIASSDFETDAGWTVSSDAGVIGGWERGTPPATDRRGGPNSDADGSGSCWTTGLALNVDLDGGTTRLTSPVFDLSGAVDPRVSMSVWMNADGSSERLGVQFSDDGGASWSTVADLGSTPGWRPLEFRVSDHVAVTPGFRVRLVANDGSGAFEDVIEAGLDAFALRFDAVRARQVNCNVADLAEPFGVLDLADVQGFVMGFLKLDPAADLAAPQGVWDLNDVSAFVSSFEGGCP
jgi:hypothetical protein